MAPTLRTTANDDVDDHNSVAQSQLLSTIHDRERRNERGIDKIDLQNARRYGMEERGYGGRLKYTYGGVVFIYDPDTNRAITSFPAHDVASSKSGTTVTRPFVLQKKRRIAPRFKK